LRIRGKGNTFKKSQKLIWLSFFLSGNHESFFEWELTIQEAKSSKKNAIAACNNDPLSIITRYKAPGKYSALASDRCAQANFWSALVERNPRITNERMTPIKVKLINASDQRGADRFVNEYPFALPISLPVSRGLSGQIDLGIKNPSGPKN
jgi:hypothetical protein